VERPQDLPLEALTDLRTSVARLETTVAHLAQFATLAAALGALVTALVS
jgi:hypothetical protein